MESLPCEIDPVGHAKRLPRPAASFINEYHRPSRLRLAPSRRRWCCEIIKLHWSRSGCLLGTASTPTEQFSPHQHAVPSWETVVGRCPTPVRRSSAST